MYTWVIQSVETTKSKIYVFLCATPPVASDAMQHLLRKSLIQPPFPDNIPTVPTSLKKSALFWNWYSESYNMISLHFIRIAIETYSIA